MYLCKRFFAFVVLLLVGTALAQQSKDAPSEHQRNLAREQWFTHGRNVPGENSALLRLRALQQKLQMRTASQAEIKNMLQAAPRGTTAPGALWTSLGPAPLASDASGTGIENYGAVSGRTTAIAIDPADPGGNTVFIGGAYGGFGSLRTGRISIHHKFSGYLLLTICMMLSRLAARAHRAFRQPRRHSRSDRSLYSPEIRIRQTA